jgi:hypothetical protein
VPIVLCSCAVRPDPACEFVEARAATANEQAVWEDEPAVLVSATNGEGREAASLPRTTKAPHQRGSVERTTGLEPATPGLGSRAEDEDARRRASTIAVNHAGLRCPPHLDTHGSVSAFQDVWGMNGARGHVPNGHLAHRPRARHRGRRGRSDRWEPSRGWCSGSRRPPAFRVRDTSRGGHLA